VPEVYREGDFIESVEGFIFDVKGMIQPSDKVVAYVRYVPCGLETERKMGRNTLRSMICLIGIVS